MDEPTLPEMIRSLSAQMEVLRRDLCRVEQTMASFVTQDQREADRELFSAKLDTLRGNQEEDRASLEKVASSRASDRRLIWSSLIGPFLVAIVVWALTQGPRSLSE